LTLSERDKSVVWHPFTQMLTAQKPLGIVRGEGAYLFAEDGLRYLDMTSSWWVNLHGHCHPYIAEKITEQLHTLEQVIFADCTHLPAVELAERLLNILPGNFSRIFYSDDGSTSIEVALKMALQFWYNQGIKKTKFIAFEGAYHGDTFGAMAVGDRSIFTSVFHDILDKIQVIFIKPPFAGKEQKSINALKELLETEEDIAAFIFEPLVQGSAGMRMYDAKPLDEILKVIHQKGILAIADEVFTGFGRTGNLFACNELTEKPDIMCVSKGITGGFLPLGVTACTQRIYEAFLSEDRTKTFFHGHSYTANPLACAAANASLDLLLSETCQLAIQRITRSNANFAQGIGNHSKVFEVRNKGTILAVELKTAGQSSYLSNIRDWVQQFFRERDILIRPLGNILYLVPPYCTPVEELERVHGVIEEMLKSPDMPYF
jgi:adenosylmethionine-8-amino-7-oxononanoate aminotransferase